MSILYGNNIHSHFTLRLLSLPVTGWQSNELSLCSVAGKLLKNSVTFAVPPFTRFPFHMIVVFSEYNFDMSYKKI